MKRSEMNPEFMWDFTPIYASQADWEAAYAKADQLIADLAKLPGTLGASADSLLDACKAIDAATEVVERVYSYAMLHKSADGGDTENQTMEARATALIMRLYSATAFFNTEIIAIDPAKLDACLADPRLEIYRHSIQDVTRSRAHVLSAQEEQLLSMLTDVSGTPSDAYDMLTDVEMKYKDVIGEDGKPMPLTSGSFKAFRESPVRSVREQAFENMFGAYRSHIDTFAALYSGAVKMDSFQAKARKFGGTCEAALFGHNVPVSVYDSLIEGIHESLPIMEKYLKLRKKALKLNKLDMFDLYTPMLPEVDFETPFAEGKKLVKAALKPLGEEYQSLLDRAYSEHWIDVYENEGKRSGAFSCGVFGVHPYVLLNYANTLDDAFTLAHELGHSMHSFFSSRTQPYVNHDYAIMVAEVASTVNEVLMTMHLLKTETDIKRRAYVLNLFLEGFRTTVFRQTLFAEFERKAHDLYDAGTPLTSKALSDLYSGLCAEYYRGVEVNDVVSAEWSYIPHFYRAYYVYQYATGFCSAVSIARKILETGDASDYLKFLSLGGSDYPIEELKVAGIDLTSPDTVRSAMKVFEDSIDELSDIIDRL